MKYLNWLHLSDLHFGQEDQEWMWPTIRDLFYRDLEKLSETAGPWDIVLFSGDLTKSGQKEEFDGLTRELEKLWEHFRSLGSQPVFLSVAGNHDLMRPPAIDPIVVALSQWHSDDKLKQFFWSSESNSYRQAITNYFQNYSSWLQKITVPLPETLILGLLPGDFSAIVESHGGLQVGIVGVNTAFLQLTDDIREGQLDIHERQVHNACSNDLAKWCRDRDAAFLLTHHGPEWLHPKAKEHLSADINPPGRFLAHMYGHLHKPNAISIREVGAEQRHYWQGASLFGLKTWGSERTERIHGYASGRIEIDNMEGKFFLWPRLMIRTYAGHYRIGPDSGYDLNEANAITIPFVVSNRKKTTDVVTQLKHEVTTLHQPDIVLSESQTGIDQDLSIIVEPLTEDAAKLKLGRIPKYSLHNDMPHHSIRVVEQEAFVLSINRDRCVWLISDWGLGTEGFLGIVLKKLKNESSLQYVYKLQCEDVDSLDNLLVTAEDQFGLSLQEFCTCNAVLPASVLIMDQVPDALSATSSDLQNRMSFDDVIHTILDYCPNMYLIIIARRLPSRHSFDYVELKPLELPDVRNYLSSTSNASSIMSNPDAVELIHMRSGGVPMHIDRLLKLLTVASINELLDTEFEQPIDEIESAEPIPKALKQAVATLSKSSKPYSRRSYRLLKVLTVLSNGATLQEIRKFYPAEPFYIENVIELVELCLLEAIPLFNPAPEMDGKKETPVNLEASVSKLLKVPRQVRDYVRLIITDEEYSYIIRDAADLLFGMKWREGLIKPIPAAKMAMRCTRPTGPGNEHVVALHLLWDGLKRNESSGVRQAARLGIAYCESLEEASLFKDVCIAAEELYHLLENTDYKAEFARIACLYGGALRMTGKREIAITLFQKLLEQCGEELNKKNKASIYLDIALAHRQNDDCPKAISAVNAIKGLVPESSSTYIHAQSILIDCGEDEMRVPDLYALEQKARKTKNISVANSIALRVVRRVNEKPQQLELLERILKTSGDDYNRVRAVLDKTDILLSIQQTSSLSLRDRYLLSLSYSYLYSQRLISLFNKCHRILWQLLKQEKQLMQLLRLFRYSSFLWRIRGDVSTERKYLEDISSISLNSLVSEMGDVIKTDLNYLARRKKEHHLDN